MQRGSQAPGVCNNTSLLDKVLFGFEKSAQNDLCISSNDDVFLGAHFSRSMRLGK